MPFLHASRRATLTATLLLGLTLSGCSTQEDGGDEGRGGRSDVADVLGTTLQVRTTVARVHGSLTPRRRSGLEQEAGRVLARYFAAAYLHERPADGYRGAFPGFTRGARALALRDVDTVADAALVDADEVRPKGAVAFLSVVAPGGRPAGATARVFLNLRVTEDGRGRTVPVRGRLLLTPVGDGWRIFGYDLSLDQAGTRRGR